MNRGSKRRNSDTGLRLLEREFMVSPTTDLAARIVTAWIHTDAWNPSLFPLMNEVLAGPLAEVAKLFIGQGFSSYSREDSVASWPSDGPPLDRNEIDRRHTNSSFNHGPAHYVELAFAGRSEPMTRFYGTPLEEILALSSPTDRGITFEGEFRLSNEEPREDDYAWSRAFLHQIKGRPVFAARGVFYGYRHVKDRGVDRFYQSSSMPWGLGHNSLDFHVRERVSTLHYDPDRFLSGSHYDSPFAVRFLVDPVSHAFPTTWCRCGSPLSEDGFCTNSACEFSERQPGRYVDLVRVTVEIAHPLSPVVVRYHQDPSTGIGHTGRLEETEFGPWVAEEILTRAGRGLVRNIGPVESRDLFSEILAKLREIDASGAPFEVIFSTNVPAYAGVIREAELNWGPFVGLAFNDRGALGVVIGTQNPRVLAELIDAIRRLRDDGFPYALETAKAIVNGMKT